MLHRWAANLGCCALVVLLAACGGSGPVPDTGDGGGGDSDGDGGDGGGRGLCGLLRGPTHDGVELFCKVR